MPTKAREQVGGAHRTPMKVPLTKRQLMKPILVFFTLVAIVASQNAFCQEKKPPVSSKVQDSERTGTLRTRNFSGMTTGFERKSKMDRRPKQTSSPG